MQALEKEVELLKKRIMPRTGSKQRLQKPASSSGSKERLQKPASSSGSKEHPPSTFASRKERGTSLDKTSPEIQKPWKSQNGKGLSTKKAPADAADAADAREYTVSADTTVRRPAIPSSPL